MTNLKTCPACNGQGFVAKWDDDQAPPVLHKCECQRCGGSGSVEMSQEESVKRLADCAYYEHYQKPVEDFDGFCCVRGEVDEEEFCSRGVRLTIVEEMTPFTEEQWEQLRERDKKEKLDG